MWWSWRRGDVVDVPRRFFNNMVASLRVTNRMQLLEVVEVSSVDSSRVTSSLLYCGTPDSSCGTKKTNDGGSHFLQAVFSPAYWKDRGPYPFSMLICLWSGIGVEPKPLMWTLAPPTICLSLCWFVFEVRLGGAKTFDVGTSPTHNMHFPYANYFDFHEHFASTFHNKSHTKLKDTKTVN